MLQISQEAIDDIIAFEVSSKKAYERLYQHPEWPGGASGVTIGIGYDCGYSTSDQIHSDWSGKIPDNMVSTLQGVAGIHGDAARNHALTLRPIVSVPWTAAIDVFANHDMPKWIGIVQHNLANTDKLSLDSLGALVSLAYNRGPSFNAVGDRYGEMRAIKRFMASEEFRRIPYQFRSMKRLWPNVKGLRDRRELEAQLFEKGLVQ